MIKGKHLIAGEWIGEENTFDSTPAHGPAHTFPSGSAELVAQAANAAEAAFVSYGWTSRSQRAALLLRIAEEIDARGNDITEIGCQETALPEARLNAERGRTVGQLRLFADHIEKGDYLDRRHDEALPDRAPLPRPDLRVIQRPVGPVAVFGASNFPLAFSVAGGDTASALAAGCPVVVKAHPAHPGTSDVVAQAIDAAVKAVGIHPGVFGLLHASGTAVGSALVQHPLIKAVGFTGSLAGGRALFDLCAGRPEPIPFFGELGSVNPVFLLPGALAERTEEIANGWVGSLTLGVGQFCTNPGLCFALDGADADRFEQAAAQAIAAIDHQTMLTEGIAEAYRGGVKQISSTAGVREIAVKSCTARDGGPALYSTNAATWLKEPALHHEVFGPLGLVVRASNNDELLACARALEGQLTCTLHMNESDTAQAKTMLPILERVAGRILTNGFPTGVEVCDAMVHGGPYPASTNFGATSVGTLAIRRFLRPVCYQNIPTALLPDDLVA